MFQRFTNTLQRLWRNISILNFFNKNRISFRCIPYNKITFHAGRYFAKQCGKQFNLYKFPPKKKILKIPNTFSMTGRTVTEFFLVLSNKSSLLLLEEIGQHKKPSLLTYFFFISHVTLTTLFIVYLPFFALIFLI